MWKEGKKGEEKGICMPVRCEVAVLSLLLFDVAGEGEKGKEKGENNWRRVGVQTLPLSRNGGKGGGG